ncbi:hypothetical protein JCM19376_06820 [Fusibacter bizertensis]
MFSLKLAKNFENIPNNIRTNNINVLEFNDMIKLNKKTVIENIIE